MIWYVIFVKALPKERNALGCIPPKAFPQGNMQPETFFMGIHKGLAQREFYLGKSLPVGIPQRECHPKNIVKGSQKRIAQRVVPWKDLA